MLPPNAGTALQAALPQVLAGLPATAAVRVFRALPGLAAALPPGLRLSFAQGMKPLHDALRAEGRGPVDDGLAEPAGLPAPSLALLLLPRSREEGRALLARAVCGLAPGGRVLAAALNEEGAKAFERDLAALMPLGGVLSKAHGRAFWTRPRPAVLDAASRALAERWIAADAPRHDVHTGLWTRPGVFNEGRLDAGSALLIAHLPASLRGRVADLGAGSGLLARAVLERCPGVTALELFEAEARALELARRHLAGARVPVGRLSQGQRRRVALARLALQPTPLLWVLDEPFDALDADGIVRVHGLIREQLARGGAVLMTSHLPAQAGAPGVLDHIGHCRPSLQANPVAGPFI